MCKQLKWQQRQKESTKDFWFFAHFSFAITLYGSYVWLVFFLIWCFNMDTTRMPNKKASFSAISISNCCCGCYSMKSRHVPTTSKTSERNEEQYERKAWKMLLIENHFLISHWSFPLPYHFFFSIAISFVDVVGSSFNIWRVRCTIAHGLNPL